MKKDLLFKLISIRIKAMIRNFGKSLPGKKKSKAMPIVIGFLLVYMVVAFEFLFVMLWDTLSVFCTVGMSWLYFALCGFLAAALTVFMNVFATQNQLYNASDNELLLSMPIPPGLILLSRMAVLLASSLGTVILVTAPAVGVYIYRIGPLTAAQTVGLIASLVAVTLCAQAVACVLGYLLHLILRRVKNKAVGSMVFMILFLVVYYTLYSKVGTFLTYLAANGEEVASFVKAWAAPFYSLGLACTGEVLHSLLLIVGAALLFAAVYRVLSLTFIRSLHGKNVSANVRTTPHGKKGYRQHSPSNAVFRKELRRLFTSAVYLMNVGLGVIMILASAAAVPFFRETITETLRLIPGFYSVMPLLIPAFISAINGMSCFTAPSVSLEGKNLWVMRAMPVSGRDVIIGKLKLHLVLTGSASTIAGLVIAASLGCSIPEVLLITVLSAEIAAFFGMLGLVFNLLFPNFTWINEAAPCKQGMPVLFVILLGMVLPILGGIGWALLGGVLTPLVYLAVFALVFALALILLYRLLVTWGGKRFESFQC
ncbi:MAG: hypothetical protein E7638_06660 [Ruminococcaceae bacterium]|nr:hypothetical protein [Oscillospiraceae bacterium]